MQETEEAAMTVDFGRTATDYAQSRAGFPEELFERLSAFGLGKPGRHVLDLGTGTGTVARGLARRGCVVTGLDKSTELMDQAKRLDAEAGVTITYVVGRAEETGLHSWAYDVVTAGQCWHWFDRPRALTEVKRVLIPGGKLVIAHFDWLAFGGNVVEATEQLITTHNPSWKTLNPGWEIAGSSGIYPTWVVEAMSSGFRELQTFSFDVHVSYTHEAWRGRIRASAGVGASMDAHAVARFDEDLKNLLAKRFPTEPLSVPHRVWAMVGESPS
jgi:SAM-dependent methyltransferase